MKRLILTLFCYIAVIVAFAQSERYAESSVLSSGDWYKIQTSETGIYKITYEELKSIGISNPSDVRVYGYGGAALSESFMDPYSDDLPEVNIYMEKGSDGVFGSGDYILFFAQGVESWTYYTSSKSFQHTTNPYSFYGYYFITSSLGAANVISESMSVSSENAIDITTFTETYLYDEDKYNISQFGRKFFSHQFNSSNLSYTFDIDIPNITNENAIFRTNIAQDADEAATIDIKVNNQSVGTLSLTSNASLANTVYANDATSYYSFTPEKTDNLTVDLTYSSTIGNAHLNYFSLNLTREMTKISSEPLIMKFLLASTSKDTYNCTVSNTSSNSQVWVVDDNLVTSLPTTLVGSNLSFVDTLSSSKQYVVVNPTSDSFKSVVSLGKVSNQNLHALGQADMLIISHSDFVSAAKTLAEAHAEYEGITTHIVTSDQVYNEFSSGTPDATAYRRFVKMFYDRATSDDLAPKYLLLFGDGSFDNRKILSSQTDKDIYKLLTYQSEESYSATRTYVTDDYFVILDDAETGTAISIGTMDAAVGRIPAYTVDQANSAVEKIIKNIKNEDLGEWQVKAIFMADDGDSNIHITDADSACNLTQSTYPNLMTIKMYFDSYKQESDATGEYYPTLNKEFLDYINSGVLMINYAGHGGYAGWSDEQVFSSSDITSLYNTRLPFIFAATCSFGHYDAFEDSAAELLVYNANGGVATLIAAARTVSAIENGYLNFEFCKEVLSRDENYQLNSVGEALRLAKNQRAKYGDINRLSFNCLGDPALKLNYPTSHTVVIDSINGKSIEYVDTVGALDLVTIKGSVYFANENNDGAIDESFNGFVHTTLLDKSEEISTLANDAGSTAFTYTYRSNTIFSGKVAVENGKFELQFLIPKDIKYNYGSGRLIFYAADEDQGLSADGSSEKLIIGGENPDAVWEEDGPEINLYLNNADFLSGDRVNENPLLVANLYDESGINTIGSGFGHDIILRLTNDYGTEEITLNSYYEALFGSYQQGTVTYQLTDLDAGEYSLFFRAWDLQNNSSSVDLDFIVVPGLKVDIIDAYVYPNPATNYANFVINHDRPSQLLDFELYIYDLSGRRVDYKKESLVSDASSYTTVNWSGLSLVNGLYLVKIIISDSGGETNFATTKLLVHKN